MLYVATTLVCFALLAFLTGSIDRRPDGDDR
ncbi:hypothetical protein EDD33_2500 [Nocardioides aurantiacus]|uniref:Uncharacterized protein n=1 Tax=Nocardioides aurantiacus TaxID=86796 RepID=A0A3N2CVQ7_9ACTN|nr:hypothetical protein EDD33_2500 [Nocardioides aurantiacus]